MRNQRTPVRSLVTNQGTCIAMDDGMIVWETKENRKTYCVYWKQVDGFPSKEIASSNAYIKKLFQIEKLYRI